MPGDVSGGFARLRRVPMMGEFLDVVDQAEELPLRVDLQAAAQREAIESFVVAQVREDRLYRPEALPVLGAALWGIAATFHARRVRLGLRFGRAPAVEEHDLARLRFLGRSDALRALWARQTVALCPPELVADPAVDHEVAALAVEGLPRRADAGPCRGIVEEVTRLIARCLGCGL